MAESRELIDVEKNYNPESLTDNVPFIDEDVQQDNTIIYRGIYKSDGNRTHENKESEAREGSEETKSKHSTELRKESMARLKQSSRVLNKEQKKKRDDILKSIPNYKMLKEKAQKLIRKATKKNPASVQAVREEDPSLLKILVSLKEGLLNKRSLNGDTALHVAIREGYFEMAKTLLDLMPVPNIEIENHKERRALHEAALANQPDLAIRLLELGAYVDASDMYLTTPLVMAAARGSLGVVKALLQFDATIILMDSTFRNATDYAKSMGYDPILEILSNVKPSRADIKTTTVAVKQSTAAIKTSTAAIKTPTAAIKTPTAAIKPSTAVIKTPTTAIKTPTAVIKPSTSAIKTSTSTITPSNFNLIPSTTTIKSSTANFKPSTVTIKPSTPNFKPSTVTIKPSTPNLKKSASNLQKSTPNLKPSTAIDK